MTPLLREIGSIVFFFLLAAGADLLSVQWHDARETRQLKRLAIVSMAMELLSWIPIWAAIQTENVWILVASILGSAAGSVWGVRRLKEADEVVEGAEKSIGFSVTRD